MSKSQKTTAPLPIPGRGEIACKLGNTSIVLVPSFKRMQKLEAALGGRSLLDIGASISSGRYPTVTECFLIVSILGREPKPADDRLGDLILRSGVMAVAEPLNDLILFVTRGETSLKAKADEDKTEEAEGEKQGESDQGNVEGPADGAESDGNGE